MSRQQSDPVVEDEYDNLVVPSRPGWSFETEAWIHGREFHSNREAVIVEIFVFDA